MKTIRVSIAAAVIAGFIALTAGPAAAPPITCPHEPNNSWSMVVPNGRTADTFSVWEVNDRVVVGARGYGGNNQVWALMGATGSSEPFWSPTWTNLGGATLYPVHAFQSEISPGHYEPAVVVVGADLNTYWRRFNGSTWLGWQAHSVGMGFWNSVGNNTYVTWSIFTGGVARYYGMGITSAYSYAASQCDWFSI